MVEETVQFLEESNLDFNGSFDITLAKELYKDNLSQIKLPLLESNNDVIY